MMASNTESKKVSKKIKDYKERDWLYVLQFGFLIFTVGTVIYTYVVAKNYQYLSDFAIALMLFIMSYNNKKIYKRANFTLIYLLFGIFFILSGIWGIFNG